MTYGKNSPLHISVLEERGTYWNVNNLMIMVRWCILCNIICCCILCKLINNDDDFQVKYVCQHSLFPILSLSNQIPTNLSKC